MAPANDIPDFFIIRTNGLSDILLMQSYLLRDDTYYMSDLYKLKLHARQIESKRNLKRNKYERGSKRM